MANLTGQNIKDTYQELVTLGGGNTITNGTGSLITDLAVTASWASNAVSASYSPIDTAFSSSIASRLTTDENLIAGNSSLIGSLEAATGSYLDGGSVVGNVITLDRVNGTTITLTVDTGSAAGDVTALSASLASRLTVDESQISTNASNISTNTSNISTNSGNISTLQGQVAALNLETGSLQGQIDSLAAVTSSYATKVELNASSSALQSNINGVQSNLDTVSASLAARDTVNEGNISVNAAGIASLTAATASYARTDINNSFTGTQTFDNIAVNGTGSFAYIQSVTGSAKIIGDAFIILNNDTPTERYAGIKVIDSGSSAVTASLQYDGQTNDWFYEYQNGDPTNYGVVIFGPEYGTIGNPTYLTNNRIPKSTGGHHIEDSNISDDGSVVSISTPVEVTGAVTASAGFNGNLDGNAATATSASYATFATSAGSAATATSASYALTASFAANVPQGEASTEAGNILFENIYGEIYGSAASPVTGNLTVDGSSVKVDGSVAVIYHTAATEPTISGATVNKKTGIYESGSLNIITLTNIDGTNILEYIAGGDVTSVASASFAISASFAVTASYAATGPFLTSTPSFQDVVSVAPAATGSIELNGLLYPSTDGTVGQALKTDGAGNLTFGDVATGLDVKDNGSSIGTIDTLDFVGGEWQLSESPTGEANISISGVTSSPGTVLFDNAIATVYGSAASPDTGNITLSNTGAKTGAVAIIYHDDATAPTITGITVDKTLGVYSEGNLNIITIIYTGANVIVSIAGVSPAVEGSAESGDLLFENQIGEIYGTSGTPLTGNITISASSTKVIGASTILYHEDSSEPTVSGGTIVKKVGSYDTGGLNMISFVYLGSGNYIQSIAGADVTGIITNSADTYTSTDKVQSIVTLTAAEYAAIGSPDANTFYIVI